MFQRAATLAALAFVLVLVACRADAIPEPEVPEPAPEPDAIAEAEPAAQPQPDAEVAPAPEANAAAAPSGAVSLVSVEGANLSIQSAETNGQRIMALQCNVDRLPLMGSMALMGSIADHKKQLDACAKSGDIAVAYWTVGPKGSREVEVSGTKKPAASECVAKAIKKVRAPFSGKCGAVLLVGKAGGADAALAAAQGG